MARKQRVFLCTLQPFLKLHKGINPDKHWFTQFLLALMTASLCILGSPFLAKAFVANSTVSSLTSSLVQTQDLVQQGKTLYDAGRFTEAVEVLEQAVSTFQAQGDKLRQAMTLSNLSLAYQQLGLLSPATRAITNSLNLLQTPTGNIGSTEDRTQALAQALDIQARLQLTQGQAELALDTWEKAAATFAQVGDRPGVIRSQINSVQALRALGFYRRALTTLTQLEQSLQSTPDSLAKAVGLRSFGDVLQLVGNVEKSRQVLAQSLQIAQRLRSPEDISAALLSLGNTVRAQGDTESALRFYQQAVSAATQTTKINAQLNQLSLLLETKQWQDAQALLPQIQDQISQLPPSRTAVYAKINFAQSLARLRQATKSAISQSDIAQLLASSVQQAKSLKDQRSESYGLGTLGALYEQNGQWSDAKDLTQQALLLTQSLNASDIAYRWQWQLGRLLKAQGDIPGAIAAYQEAVNTLQSLRGDLVAINPTVQFSFRESVEPVYRQLVGLLLESVETTKSEQKVETTKLNQNKLAQALTVFESLQQAELINFFRENCVDAKPVQINSVDQQAAVIYPIILPDRLEVILSLPQQPLRHFATPLPQERVEHTADELRQRLLQRTSRQSLQLSQQMYNWLIRPAETDLVRSKVKTLVFVLDGSLRNIPMAALHDGKHYLMEEYAIALTPGLALLDPQPLARGQLKVLTAGISKAHQGFPALTYVEPEINEILSQIPGKELLNQKFTDTTLRQEISKEPFPIVHLATHGQFSSKAEETFILTWDGRINVGELNNILQTTNLSQSSSIELLVLSACETARGDNRAALGLAGVAVRAGARSTLATLWTVEDEATTDFMKRFYQELANATVTKAEALRRAQKSILQNPNYRQRPYYWAPYVLVGNWL